MHAKSLGRGVFYGFLCAQETRIENHKKLHAQNQKLMRTTALQKEQKPLLDTPEDGQLGRNM
jgi:hypothetical protein